MTERVIRIVIDPKGAVQGGRRVEGALGRVEKQSKRTTTSVVRAAKALAGALVVREVIAAANTYQELQNKLRLVTDGTENLADITEELFTVAQSTRSSFESTVDLYSRVARSTTELGVSQRDLLQFTEAVSQAIQISGATAQEASSGVVQFGQALASGRLSGDELRSVLEQLPSLARELAAGLGVTIGEIRKLGQSGALTAEAVFAAVQSRIPQIAEQFAKITPTLAQSFTVLQNSALGFIGSLDEMTGAGDALAEFIIDLAADLDIFSDAITGTLEPGQELTENMQNLAIAAIVAAAGVKTLFGLLAIGPSFIKDVGQGLGGVAAALVELDTAISGEILNLFGAEFVNEDNFAQAGRIFAAVWADGLDDSQESTTDFFEDFAASTAAASEKISAILLDSFRKTKEGASTITEEGTDLKIDLGAAAAAVELERLLKKQAEFIASLEQINEALTIAADTGADYDRVLEDLQVRDLSGGDLVWLAEADALVLAKRNAEDYADAKERLFDVGADNKAFIEDLLIQNEAMRRAVETGEDLADVLEEIAIRQRFITDGEGLDEALDLLEANRKLEDQLEDAEEMIDDFLKRARENSQDVLAGFLADPLAEGLDDLPRQFARVLLDLAAQALASEIFKLLGGIGRDSSGSAGAGIAGFIGAFFGGASHGADVGQGDFGVVGEEGPEVFQAPAAGSIVPNQAAAAAPNVTVPVSIVNTIDPSDIVGAFQDGSGDEVILNRLSVRKDAARAALGIG